MRPRRNPGSRSNYFELSYDEGVQRDMAGTKQQRFMGNVRRNPEKLVNSRPNTLEEID